MAIIRQAGTARFKFSAGSLANDELRVLSFRGSERLSQLFRFSFELVSEDAEIPFESVVGQPAAFVVSGPSEARHLHGIVCRFEQGDVGKRLTRYYAEVVPRQWRLDSRIDSRIFQQKSVPAILQEVFDGAQIPKKSVRMALQGSYAEREYVVQYQESDWSFASRLMEQEGIFYYFEHGDDDHVMVLSDDASVHKAVAGDSTLDLRPEASLVADEEFVASFQYAESVTIGAVQVRDFSFKTPRVKLDGQARADRDVDLELFEYPGDYHASAVAARFAKVRLGEEQAGRKVGSGRSGCCRLVPGFTFTLAQHARSELNREWTVEAVHHDGYEPQALEEAAGSASQPARYSNEFRCIPSSVCFRPARVTPSPFVRGTQSAIVTGPKGEEIYTDEYGRVKLQFHWDRRGQSDEKSSCWVRVSQQWAGGGYGFVWIPRIGQEVIVAFHEGDPEQPHVVGRVYNQDHMPPYGLPGEKTKSTFKSSSSPGGGGFNEIRFEDKKGSEEIFVHAQKDENIVVGNDKTENVGHDETIAIANDRVETVSGNETLSVVKNRTRTVSQNETVTVSLTRSHTVGVNEMINVGAAQEVTVGAGRALNVGLAQTTNIGLAHNESVGADHSEQIGGGHNQSIAQGQTVGVGGARNVSVGGAQTTKVGAAQQIAVGADRSLKVSGNESVAVSGGRSIEVSGDQKTDVGGSLQTSAKGDASLTSNKKIAIAASDEIVIQVGSAKIAMKKNGDIEIEGANIAIKGSSDVKVKGSKIVLN